MHAATSEQQGIAAATAVRAERRAAAARDQVAGAGGGRAETVEPHVVRARARVCTRLILSACDGGRHPDGTIAYVKTPAGWVVGRCSAGRTLLLQLTDSKLITFAEAHGTHAGARLRAQQLSFVMSPLAEALQTLCDTYFASVLFD